LLPTARDADRGLQEATARPSAERSPRNANAGFRVTRQSSINTGSGFWAVDHVGLVPNSGALRLQIHQREHIDVETRTTGGDTERCAKKTQTATLKEALALP
jgi:hypothetical protein